MKKIRQIATEVLLAVLVVALTVVVPPQRTASATPLSPEAGQRQQQKKVEVLKGEAVRLRVLQLRAKDKSFDRAMKDMEKMGKRPNWELSAVILRGDKAIAQAKSPTIRPVSYTRSQDTFSDDQGEMTFITYDGADENRWDGTVYAYDYYEGQSYSYNGVLNDYESSDTAQWAVMDEVYYPPDGSGPYREQPCYDGNYCLQMEVQAIKTSPQPSDKFMKAAFGLSANPPAAVGFLGFLSRFFRCFFRAIVPLNTGCRLIASRVVCLIAASALAGSCCVRAARGGSVGQGSPYYCY